MEKTMENKMETGCRGMYGDIEGRGEGDKIKLLFHGGTHTKAGHG